MKKQCIVFGTDSYGESAYYRLKEHYNIVYYVDDNRLNNKEKFIDSIPIISTEEFAQVYSYTMDFIICSQEYLEIIDLLKGLRIADYYVMKKGFLYHYSKTDILIPCELSSVDYYRKENGEKSILFVQDTMSPILSEWALVLRNYGYKIFILYTITPPEMNISSKVEEVYTFFSPFGLLDFINNSNFDLVHCSSSLDYLTAMLTSLNKPVIHECRDLHYIGRSMSPEEITAQYIAHTRSNGVIYPTADIRDVACEKFAISKDKTYVMKENYAELIPFYLKCMEY